MIKRISSWVNIFAVVFVAMNMRGPITSVGPLSSVIAQNTKLTMGSIGLLTTIPLLVFSLTSYLSSPVIKHFGINNSIFAGLLLILIGEIFRSYTNLFGLYLGTLIMSIGIGLENILILLKVKEKFSTNSGIMISIYTSTMTLMAGIGAWVSAMLVSNYNWGWRQTLSIWIVIALGTIFIWFTQMRKKQANSEKENLSKKPLITLLNSRLNRKIIIHIGLQSLLFYCMTTWLPEILHSHSIDMNEIGNLMFLLQILNGVAGFSIPILLKMTKKPILLIGILSMFLFFGIGGLLFGQHLLFPVINVILIAIGLGSAFTLGISLINYSTTSSSETSTTYGLALSMGYLLAAVGPFMLGFIYDLSGSWIIPLIILLLVVLSIVINGVNRDFASLKL